jgi:hypothetical protein
MRGASMDGKEFKKIRVEHLKLSAAALGHALGYEGSDANIARTIYRLESSGRRIPKPIERLLEMFKFFGVPWAWAGEVTHRKREPKWADRAGGR